MIVNSNPYEHGPTDHNAWQTDRPQKKDDKDLYNDTTKPVIKGTSTNNEKTNETEAVTDLYMSDGDDYYIDDSAFAGAQLGTGENSVAASVDGSSSGESGSSEVNSNVNTGVFGGSARAAKPGASLW